MSLLISTGDSGTMEGTVSANLTGATARANIKHQSTGTVTSKTCTIPDAEAGTWAFDYDADDFTAAGIYLTEIEVTFSNGKTQSFAKEPNGRDNLKFQVRDQYA